MNSNKISMHIVRHSPMELIKVVEVIAVPKEGDTIKITSSPGESVYFKVVCGVWIFDDLDTKEHTVNLFVERIEKDG